MLRNKFYKVRRLESSGESVKASIAFEREHPIFEGHFPGHPVVPGVCMMQILREVLEDFTSERLNISRGENLKFLAIINPDENKEVDVELSYSTSGQGYNVTGSLHAGPTIFFKFKGTFSKA